MKGVRNIINVTIIIIIIYFTVITKKKIIYNLLFISNLKKMSVDCNL